LYLEFLKTFAGIHAEKIIHFNKIPHTQLFPVIKNSELVVLPSLVDNFPNTCVEAMAMKKIVIGTIGNGFEQLIEDGTNGYLIKIDDSEALLEKVNTFCALSSEQKKNMEEQALERIQLLTPEIAGNTLVNFYKQIISKFKCAE
jgi:glycosyltransferase involved in cell wall biosynthesis